MERCYKECELVMVQSDEKVNIIQDKGQLEFIENAQIANTINSIVKGFHLYILSNEAIREGNWFIEFDLKGIRSTYCNKPFLCDIGNTGNFILTKYNGNFPFPENCKKIIASTNNLWIINNKGSQRIAEISKSFIEKFVEEYNKGNIITKVMVEYEQYDFYEEWSDVGGAYITYNERIKINPDNTINIKLPEEKTYTKEEIIELFEKYQGDRIEEELKRISGEIDILDCFNTYEWLEKNLK